MTTRSLPGLRQSWWAGLTMALASSTVCAQSNVQIYGLMDVGVEHLSRVQNGEAKTRMPTVTGGQMASRLGFRGSEDLGHGMRVQFVLEAGFAPSKGEQMQGGRAFGRQSYLALNHADWGTVSMGRQYMMSLYAMMGSDLMGPSVFGLGSLDAYLPNQRADNALAWRYTQGNWMVGALYSLGRDSRAPSNCAEEQGSGDCGAWSALVKYDNRRWGVSLAHDRQRGTQGSRFFGQPAGTTVTTGSRDDRTFLTGYFLWGETRLGAGVIRRELKALPRDWRSNQYYIALSQPLTGAFVLDATYTYLDANWAQSDAQLYSMRLNYKLSKRTSLYALIGQVRNQDAVGYSVSGGTSTPASPGLGRHQTGLMLGMVHSF